MTRSTAALLLLLVSLPVPAGAIAEPPWRMVRSPNFIVLGDAGEKPLQEVAIRLEQFRTALGRMLPGLELATPVPTVLDYITLTLDSGHDGAALEQLLRDYVKRSAYRSAEYTFRTRVEAGQGTVRALSAAETEGWLGDLLLHMNRLDEAGPRLKRALELDPDLARALSPESTDALSLLGYASLRDDAHLDAARAALTRAVKLAPGRPEYALLLAEVCVRQRDYAKARSLLTILAATSDERGTSARARSMLERLDALQRGR